MKIRTRIRTQQRAVKMTILALLTIKRHQRTRKVTRTAQRTKEVAQMTVEMHKAILALTKAAEAEDRIKDRMMARITNLEAAVANLAKKKDQEREKMTDWIKRVVADQAEINQTTKQNLEAVARMTLL
jgi:hypothetical protein